VGSTDTRATVFDRFVGDREFSQVVSNHFRLNFDLVKILSRVDTNDRSDHLRDNDHVAKMSLDKVGLLVRLGLLLGLAELLDQAHRLAFKATVEPSTSTGVDEVTELFGGKVEELVEVDSTVGKLAEGSRLLLLSGLNGVIFGISHVCCFRRVRVCGPLSRGAVEAAGTDSPGGMELMKIHGD